MNLPPFKLITKQDEWQACLNQLQEQPKIAIDLEANSMHAYRERVCLIQISIPGQDFIVDPLADLQLEPFGSIIKSPDIEKIFHAAEYDLILIKRQFGWKLHNLFDTMWAARILGYPRYGLANMLQELYQVKLNKRFQKSDWCKRPLSAAQLAYAQLDTHYLLGLREDLGAELAKNGRIAEANETFAQQTQVKLPDNRFYADSFWSINGAHDLSKPQQSVLKALHIYRNDQAKYRDRPIFKIINDRTLVKIAKKLPRNAQELRAIRGMTNGQMRRYSKQILQIVNKAKKGPYPRPPRRGKRLPEPIVNRYEKLHNWRKLRARARGVESDVIVSREALWAIAHDNPQTMDDLCDIEAIGTWRCHTYGTEIIELLNGNID